MATANCLNCDREPWELQKHPADYSGDGPNCPSCGSTRVDIEYDGERSQQGGAEGRGQQQTAQTPARRGQQGGGQAPARRGGGAESAGDALAQGLLAVTSEEASASERVGAASNFLEVAADGVTRYVQYREQIEEQQRQHAEEASLVKEENLPRCDECDFVFKRIPRGEDTIECPECGEVYAVQ